MENKSGGNIAMKMLKFLWVDDDTSRKRSSESIEEYEYKNGQDRIKANVVFLSLRKADAFKVVSGYKFAGFDLILIDHILTHTVGVIRKGNTLAEIIREKVPRCPIVGVTAAGNRRGIDQHALTMYDDLFISHELSNSYNFLFVIALTFKKVSKMRLRTQETRMKLIAPPKDDAQLLKQILPKMAPNTKFDRTFLYWVLHSLTANPGLLYNRSWAANLAGIKESSFYKVEPLFKAAKYQGIFSDEKRPLWWKSGLKEIIFEKSKNKSISVPWEAGHFLPRISRRDYSACYHCNGYSPETMGYSDTETRHLVPLHYKHSRPYPANKNELFFDEIRIMSDAKPV